MHLDAGTLLALHHRFAYVRENPFLLFVTVKLPSRSAEILIQ